uniref:Uncharacterized protein n=1 Tax=Rhizophora mucronata TaxID=61149 RepID=A0A2P2P7T3_RHIMU
MLVVSTCLTFIQGQLRLLLF